MANDPTTTGLPGDDNVKESIEFEPVLRTDIIESQLDSLRSRIENAFGMANFDPVAGLQTSLNGPINSIQNGGERLLQSSQNVINSFMAAPETVSREFGMTSSGIGNTAHNIDQMSANVGSFGSLFGAGYDWRSPVQRSDYAAESNKRAGRAVGDFVADNIGTGIGLAVGWGNPIIGLGVGKAFDVTVGAGIEREHAIRDLAHNFRDIANESRTTISKDTSKDLARMMYDKAESFEGYATDLTVKELKENIGTFANAGGFRNVRSPQEFKETVEAVINNTRDISKTLGMFQDEVLNLMAELKNKGIATVSESKELLLGLQGQATASGVNTNDLIQQGFAASEMFKGTRFGQKNAFNYGIDVYSQMERMYRNNDDIYGGAIIRQGGPAGAARNMMGVLARFGQQDAMPQYYYEQSTGQNYTGNIEEKLFGGPEYFEKYGINGLLAANGRENEIAGKNSAQRQAQLSLQSIMDEMNYLGIGKDANGNWDRNAVAGYYMQQKHISRDQAELNIGFAAQDNGLEQLYNKQGGEAFNRLKNSNPSVWGEIAAAAETGWDIAKSPFMLAGKGISAIGSGISHLATYMLDDMGGNFRIRSDELTDEERALLSNGDYDKYMSDIFENKNVVKAKDDLYKAAKNLGGFDPSYLNKESSIGAKTKRYISTHLYTGNTWDTEINNIIKKANGDPKKIFEGVKSMYERRGVTPSDALVSQTMAYNAELNNAIKDSDKLKGYTAAETNLNETIAKTYDESFDTLNNELITRVKNHLGEYEAVYKNAGFTDKGAKYLSEAYMEALRKGLSGKEAEDYIKEQEKNLVIFHNTRGADGKFTEKMISDDKLNEAFNKTQEFEGDIIGERNAARLRNKIKEEFIAQIDPATAKKGTQEYKDLINNLDPWINSAIQGLTKGDLVVSKGAINVDNIVESIKKQSHFDSSRAYIDTFDADKVAAAYKKKLFNDKITAEYNQADIHLDTLSVTDHLAVEYYTNFNKTFKNNSKGEPSVRVTK